jgi:hypothetical protein
MTKIILSTAILLALVALSTHPAQAKYTNPRINPHYAYAKFARSVAKGHPLETAKRRHVQKHPGDSKVYR